MKTPVIANWGTLALLVCIVWLASFLNNPEHIGVNSADGFDYAHNDLGRALVGINRGVNAKVDEVLTGARIEFLGRDGLKRVDNPKDALSLETRKVVVDDSILDTEALHHPKVEGGIFRPGSSNGDGADKSVFGVSYSGVVKRRDTEKKREKRARDYDERIGNILFHVAVVYAGCGMAWFLAIFIVETGVQIRSSANDCGQTGPLVVLVCTNWMVLLFFISRQMDRDLHLAS